MSYDQANVTDSGSAPIENIETQVNVNEAVQDVYTNNSPKENLESNWLLNEGVNGAGEKPEWFNDKKYKNVAEQAKAYNELRKKLGDVPNEYKLDLGESYKDMEISSEDPLLVTYNKYAKENKLSNKAYNSLVKMFVDFQKNNTETQQKQFAENQTKELDAIGVDAKQKLEELGDWYAQNFGEDSLEEFRNSIQTKKDFDRYSTMREKWGYPKVSNETNSSANRPFELSQMMGDSRYAVDINYTKMVDNEYNKFYGKK